MMDWVKVESAFVSDSRIRCLMDELGYSGLGIYLAIRIGIESMNADGLPMAQVAALCSPWARRSRVNRVVEGFGLFEVSEFGVVTVLPLACGPAHEPVQASARVPGQDVPVVDRREDKGMMDKKSGFSRPSLDEVAEYCRMRGNRVDAARFFRYYESRGWVVGSSGAMRDWRAAVRGWERRSWGGDRVDGDVCGGDGVDAVDGGVGVVDCSGQVVPEWAPPKPSERALWDYATDSWSEFY